MTSTPRPIAAASVMRSANPPAMTSRPAEKRQAGKAVYLALAAGAMLFGAAGAAQADSTFHFSFTDTSNDLPHVGGTVSGRIFGLPADGTDMEASSIVIDSITPNNFFFSRISDLPAPPITLPATGNGTPTVFSNAFTTVGGTLTSGSYSALWPDVARFELNVTGDSSLDVFLSMNYGDFDATVAGPATFATAAVPEPKTYAMLLAGLGLMGFMARRVKH